MRSSQEKNISVEMFISALLIISDQKDSEVPPSFFNEFFDFDSLRREILKKVRSLVSHGI